MGILQWILNILSIVHHASFEPLSLIDVELIPANVSFPGPRLKIPFHRRKHCPSYLSIYYTNPYTL